MSTVTGVAGLQGFLPGAGVLKMSVCHSSHSNRYCRQCSTDARRPITLMSLLLKKYYQIDCSLTLKAAKFDHFGLRLTRC